MATNGIVSVVKDGRVVLKIIAGCDGCNGRKLAELVNEHTTPEQARIGAKHARFGCPDCLVVQTPDRDHFEGSEALDPLYRDKFCDPRFNPRWERGTCPQTYIRSETGIECPPEE